VKRRQLLKLLGLVPLVLLFSCKDKQPSTPTIVKGKIIDENGNPLEGAGLRLSGVKLKGFSGFDTFSITAESDKDGMYELSQVAPQNTDQISILPRTTDKVPLDMGFGGYHHYIFIGGKYVELGAPYDIPLSDWGKTITLNYQFIKK
jgi:hypothetical protein